MKDFIELQTAYATQTTTEYDGKGEWIVYNTDKKEIYKLPNSRRDKSRIR